MKTYSAFLLLLLTISCSGASKAENTGNDDIGSSGDKEVVCFVYHRFGDSRYPSTNVSLKDFEAHLKYLKEHNYQVLTFEKAIAYLKSSEPEKKTAVITIDDGYQSFYENGLPLLEKYNYPATLFVNTQTVGGADYMGWEALKDAAERKVEIGNHTHSHAYFLNLPESSRYTTFTEEIQLSQKLIKDHLGITPATFAYPYGELDDQMKSIVAKAGFVGAAAQNSGVITTDADLMKCPRFPMSESYANPDKFASKARMHGVVLENESPASFMLPANAPQPTLTLEVKKDALITSNLNCFIQGSDCNLKTEELENGNIRITAKATSSIAGRRRTLYTITGQDKSGGWHWYSHLWINPEKK